MAQTILYYPTINIQDSAWLRNAVLYWDEVSSIVPYEDYPNFSPEVLFLQRSGVYKAVYPQKLFSSEFAEDFCNSIVKRIAAYEARTVNNENTNSRVRVHKNKVYAPALHELIHYRKLPPQLLGYFENKRYINDYNVDGWMEIPKSALQEVGFILIALCDFINELFPPLTLHITAYCVPETGLHCEEIVPPWFTERVVLQRVSTVETVYEVGVGVEIRSRNAEFTCCVLEYAVAHTPVTHLVHERGVRLAGIIVRNLATIEYHQANKVLDFLGDKDCTLVLAPRPLKVGVPTLVFGAVPRFTVVEHTEQVCHTHFRPLKAGGGFVCPFGVIGLDNIHFVGQVFVHNAPAVAQFKKFSVTCHL